MPDVDMKPSPGTPDPAAGYVTNLDRQVFAIRGLPEEVVAVLFAYYSRSTDSLRDNLRRLLREVEVPLQPGACEEDEDSLRDARNKAQQFHEKWVVGYGHSSVAEHAVVHLAMEDVSILASKTVEDARLGSYTEKSTRYVVFDENRYYTPPVYDNGSDAALYAETCRFLLGTYARLVPKVIDKVKSLRPRTEKQTERGWETACKASACDILRYLLPTATRTNIGLTANARTLEHMIVKLLSHPLEECQDLGTAMKEEARKIVPTLIKYADQSGYLTETRSALESLADSTLRSVEPVRQYGQQSVRLLRMPSDPERDLAAAILYEHSHLDWQAISDHVSSLSPEQRQAILRETLEKAEDGGRRGNFDQPLRALEHLYYTFEVLIDFGAFRDIQRHRMATQTRQRLTPEWGYDTPPEIEELGLLDEYRTCMDRAAAAWRVLSVEHPEEAQYVLPLAYRVRALYTWNLRELHHFISLRSGKQGHRSYRRVAQEVWRCLHAVHPLLADFIRVDMKDYPLARA